jgi:Mg-chelatase subunit ChlD
MRRLSLLILCCLTAVLHAQRTISVPIIVAGGNQASIAVEEADLRAEVNHQTVTIASVTPLADRHLQYVLLNDQSGSTRWPDGIKQQTEVADQFLKQVVEAGSDIGSLVNFDDDVYIDVQNEKDPLKLAGKLERKGVGGGTKLYDAVVSAAKWLAKQPVSPDHRKVIFLFCDGEDNASKSRLSEAIDTLQRATIPIFIIAPSSVETKKPGEKLRQLSSETGGRVYFLPRDTKHVEFALLKQDLTRSFLLKINIPSAQGALPLVITDRTNPQDQISAPSQIVAPQ